MNLWMALFSVTSFIALAAPFFLERGREEGAQRAPEPLADERIRQIRWAMEELELDAASGKIGAADRDALRAELEDEMTQALGQAPPSGDGFGAGVSRG